MKYQHSLKKLAHILFCLLITKVGFSQNFWSELGSSSLLNANSYINSICSDTSGNIYAAGLFTNSNGKYYVAKWNGTNWTDFGAPNGLNANDWIRSICSDDSGYIYAAGDFSNSNGSYVAKWNGTKWTVLNGLNANGYIFSLCSDSVGNIYAAGRFTNSNGKYYVAKWNGSSWTELGGLNGLHADDWINSICSDDSGYIYAAGRFTNLNGKCYVAKWNGSSWIELGGKLKGLNANDWINSLCSDIYGNIYAAGQFTNSGTKYYVAKWNGSSWNELGGLNGLNANDWIRSIYSNPSGYIYAAGDFTNLNGKQYVAKCDGNFWDEVKGFGLQVLGANDWIRSICGDPSGNIYAAGSFTNSNNMYYVAKFSKCTNLSAASISISALPPSNGKYYVAGTLVNYSAIVLNTTDYTIIWNVNGNEIDTTTSPNSTFSYNASSTSENVQATLYVSGCFTDSAYQSNKLIIQGCTELTAPVLSADPPNNVVAGTRVHYTANVGNVTNYSLDWYINGNLVKTTHSTNKDTLSREVSVPPDTVQVILRVTGFCKNTYTSNTLIICTQLNAPILSASPNDSLIPGIRILYKANVGNVPNYTLEWKVNRKLVKTTNSPNKDTLYLKIKAQPDTVQVTLKVKGFCDTAYLSNKIHLTGIPDLSEKMGLSIYPNPTKDIIYINSNEGNLIESIKIVNTLGQTIKEVKPSKTNSRIEVDMQLFTNGIYFVNIELKKENQEYRIVHRVEKY